MLNGAPLQSCAMFVSATPAMGYVWLFAGLVGIDVASAAAASRV
jgi:hypothetical protein